jgi:hypothetical protein
MVLMAIDHASYFIAQVHSAEFWGVTLPFYPDASWFWMRWITHLCAPGFFLLMGNGMALFAVSRRKARWSENRITQFFVLRGVFLILLQLFVENPAWRLGDLSVAIPLKPGLSWLGSRPYDACETDGQALGRIRSISIPHRVVQGDVRSPSGSRQLIRIVMLEF